MLPGLLPQLQVRVGVAPLTISKTTVIFLVMNIIFALISGRKLSVSSLQDAHLKLQPIQDFHQVMHISQELMGGGDLLCVLVRVILLQE